MTPPVRLTCVTPLPPRPAETSDHSNRMWCRAGALVALCAGERFAAALRVAGLTHTCVERPERGGRLCPSDSAVRSAERQRNLRWYAVSFQCHLCVCVCLCVSFCGICTSSITDTRGLSALKAKKPVQATSCEQASGHSNTTYLRLCEKTPLRICYRFNGCNYNQ